MSYEWVREEVDIPEELPELLRDFGVETLRRQLTTRAELVRFGATWFKSVADAHRASPIHTMTAEACLSGLLGALAAEDTAGTGLLPHAVVQRVIDAPGVSFTWVQRLVAYSCMFESDDGTVAYREAVEAAVAMIYERGEAGAVERAVGAAPALLHGSPADEYVDLLAQCLEVLELPCTRVDVGAVLDESELGLTAAERNVLMAVIPPSEDETVSIVPLRDLVSALYTVNVERIGPAHAFTTVPAEIEAVVAEVVAAAEDPSGFTSMAAFKAALLSADLGLTHQQSCSLIALAAAAAPAGTATAAAIRDIAPGFIRRLRLPQRLAVLNDVPPPATVVGRGPEEVTALVAEALAEAAGDLPTIHAAVAQRMLASVRFEPDEAAVVVAVCETEGPDVDPEDVAAFAYDALVAHTRERLVQDRLQ